MLMRLLLVETNVGSNSSRVYREWFDKIANRDDRWVLSGMSQRSRVERSLVRVQRMGPHRERRQREDKKYGGLVDLVR